MSLINARQLLNNMGILDTKQQQQLAAELVQQRTTNRQLQAQLDKAERTLAAIKQASIDMYPNYQHADLVQWDEQYTLACAYLDNLDRRVASDASAPRNRRDLDQKAITARNASRAQQLIRS